MMTDGPDPLGKRAFFWMPVDAEVQIDAGEEFELGSVGRNVGGQRADTLTQRRSRGEGVRHARPAGKHALYSRATPADEADRDRASVILEDPLPQRGSLSVACSRCGSVTRVGLVGLLLLQFPFGVWLPRGAFDRWMTCPSCRQRSWMSVTLFR